MKKILFSLSVVMVMFISGCASLKPAADIGNGIASFPACRAALIDWAPSELMDGIQEDFNVLDKTWTALLAQVMEQPDISLEDALLAAVDVPDTVDELESSYLNIEVQAKTYDPPEKIKKCNETTKIGWKALTDNDVVATALEYLSLAAQYRPLVMAGAALL